MTPQTPNGQEAIRQQIALLSAIVLHGRAASFEDYQALCARIEAFEFALAMVEAAEQAREQATAEEAARFFEDEDDYEPDVLQAAPQAWLH